MYTYDTITEAFADLKKRGYEYDFNIRDSKLACDALQEEYKQGDFEIKEMYRFEGPSDPADEAVVYAIEAPSGKLGMLVNGYGPSADDQNSDFLQHLKEKNKF